MNNNELLGTIPTSLGFLFSLTNLNLGVNRLTGSLPTTFSALTRLQQMDLHSNFMHGSIPQGLSAMASLDYLRLNNSGLCGTSPWSAQPVDGALPVCSLSANFTCTSGLDTVVCSALGDLYFTTGGAGWARNDGWKNAAAGIPTNYCAGASFYGAQCDGSTLIRLQLPANRLVGSIVSTIGNLR